MPKLSVEVVYHDEHLMEILTTATNDRFSGVSIVYLSGSGRELIDFGNQLKGFPKSINQIEEIEFGVAPKDQQDSQNADTAYVGLKFYCIDGSGHPAVSLTLHEDRWSKRREASGKAGFEIRFEPAQLDKFAEEVIELGKNKEGIAILQGIHDGKDSFI